MNIDTSSFVWGYMDKTAGYTWGDAQDAFNKVTINPAVRAGLIGTAGYFGAKHGYNYLTNKAADKEFEGIEDPEERRAAYQAFKNRQKKSSPWVAAGGAAVGALLPFSQMPKTQSELNENSTMVELLKKAWEEMSSRAPYKNTSSDLVLGRDFVMPALRPISSIFEKDIPTASSIDLVKSQASIVPPDVLGMVVDGIDNSTPGPSGLASTIELAQGLSRAGFGAVSGLVLGNILGTIFSQPASVKSKLAGYGAIGGAILNSGVLRRIDFNPFDRSNKGTV